MGSHVALVKGNRQMGFQVDRATHIFLVLVKGDRQTGSQVSPTTQIFVFGSRRSPDGISQKKKKREKERKRARSLDEWILSRQKGKFFFTKLTMRNIEEFCFVSIVKRGHLLLPNF